MTNKDHSIVGSIYSHIYQATIQHQITSCDLMDVSFLVIENVLLQTDQKYVE